MHIDLAQILLPDTPPLEIVVRGTLLYLAIFVILRIARNRQAGAVSLPDLLVVVLIADAAQNGMTGDYKGLADGVLLVATIVFWAYALDWLGYRFAAVERLVHPPPLLLVRDGRLNRRNLRAELITKEELMSQLRAQGVERVEEVRRAYLEGNGELTVIRVEEKGSESGRKRQVDQAA